MLNIYVRGKYSIVCSRLSKIMMSSVGLKFSLSQASSRPTAEQVASRKHSVTKLLWTVFGLLHFA